MPQIQVSRVVFGAMALPGQSDALRKRLIHSAIDHGITSFDTAPLYGAGESERILGQAVKGRRDHVQILTKCGLRWDSDHGQPMFQMAVEGKMCTVRKDSRVASIREGLDTSLRNLGTDVIDLFQVHHLDDRTPVEDTMGELDRALAAGKIRAIGISNYPLKELRQAHAALAGGLFSTQSPFSLLDTRVAAELMPAVRTAGIAFLAYEPLARGLLAGKYLDRTQNAPRGTRRANAVVKEVVLRLAQERGLTPAQIALAWLLAQPGVTAVIAGASSEKQLAENAAAPGVRLEQPLVSHLAETFRTCQYDPEAPPGLAFRLRRRAGRLKHAVRRRLERWFRRSP